MEKIFRLIGSEEPKALEKLIYLDRLIRIYAKFLTYWKTAGVYSDGKRVCIKFVTINKYGYVNFTEREFPMDDIDKRTKSYKEKMRYEFVKRHDNIRIQRVKEIHKWKIYIKNAKSDAEI